MSTNNEYLDQLSGAIDATRTALLNELSQGQADENTALSGREAAAHDKWSALKQVIRDKQVRMAATKIEELAKRTQLITGNLNLYAQGAQNDAQTVISAMADAASNIKQAAAALESLTRVTHGITAITEANDRPDDVNTVGKAAKRAVEHAMAGADVLKGDSITASIEASMPLAGTVAETISLLNDQVGAVASEAVTALGAARSTVDTATGNRNSTWTRYYATVAPFEQALLKHQGLNRSFESLDRIANDGLTVALDNVGGVAGLQASVKALPREPENQYQPPLFLAVNEADVYRFTYDGTTNQYDQYGAVGEPVLKDKERTFSAHLAKSTDGQPITYGKTYRVFAVRKPSTGKGPAPAAPHDPEPGQSPASDKPSAHEPAPPATQTPPLLLVTMPSRPIVSAFDFRESQPPVVGVYEAYEPFLVIFDLGASDPEPNLEYRLVILPSKLWLLQQADDLFLLNRASPADYTVLTPLTAGDTFSAVTERLYNDLRVLHPGAFADRSLDDFQNQLPESIKNVGGKLAANPGRVALAYFSPVPSEADSGKPAYKFGSYSDMCGDEIDLSLDTYRAVVLAVGKGEDSNTTALSVLSSPSDPFPSPAGDPPSAQPNNNRLTNHAIFLA